MTRIRAAALPAAASLLILCFIAGQRPSNAQQALDLKTRYTKIEQMIPMRDGAKLFTSIYAPKDTAQKYPIQRFASTRPDVLTYQTPVLTEDLTLAGPITASLIVSTTGTDSDFIVKLIDVYPDDAPDNDPNLSGVKMGGYQMLVRGEPMRARFRNSFEKPEPMPAGRKQKIEFVLPDANHTSLKGHRVMVQVQSTGFHLWIATFRSLSTSTRQKSRTFRKRPSVSITHHG